MKPCRPPPEGRPPPGLCGELSCILEATARKPGNVSRFRDFDDAGFLHFLFAAAAIGRTLDQASRIGVGQAVLECVEWTRALAGTNANLGLILLLSPLAAAAGRPGAAGREDRPLDRAAVEGVLAGLTAEDGERVYRAIRLAQPGGLGSAPEEDVTHGPPSRPLVEAMALASERDLVARQYANGFREVFEDGLCLLDRELSQGVPLEPAIVRCHLHFMAHHPDSLIARTCGTQAAREAASRAAQVLEKGWPAGEEAEAAFRELDHWLREDHHRRNPGTSADLVGASLFVAIAHGIIPLPLPQKAWSWKSTGCG